MSTVLISPAVVDLVKYEESGILYTDFADGDGTTGTYQVGFTLPARFYVSHCEVVDVTGFTGDTTATIQIGDGSDADRYNAGTPSVVATITGLWLGVPAGIKHLATENRPTITVTGGANFTAISAGTLTLRVYGYMT